MESLQKFEQSVLDEVNSMGAAVIAALISRMEELKVWKLIGVKEIPMSRSSFLDKIYDF